MGFLPINIGFDSYCDHYIISSINKKSLFYCNVIKSSYNYIKKPLVFILLDRLLGASLYNDDFIAIRLKTEKDKASINIEPIIYSYLFDISQYILLPIYSFIRLFVYSF